MADFVEMQITHLITAPKQESSTDAAAADLLYVQTH